MVHPSPFLTLHLVTPKVIATKTAQHCPGPGHGSAIMQTCKLIGVTITELFVPEQKKQVNT